MTEDYEKITLNNSSNSKIEINRKIKKIDNSNLIYGNDINIKQPKKLGNSFVFCYINNWPLITIGPNCIYYNYIFRLLLNFCYWNFKYIIFIYINYFITK
jgi:hypothetical protein